MITIWYSVYQHHKEINILRQNSFPFPFTPTKDPTQGETGLRVGLTYRLQLVHEFDQELSALWCFTVQLHACLHSIEPTCRRGQEGGERWGGKMKGDEDQTSFYCSVKSVPPQTRSNIGPSRMEDSLCKLLMNFFTTTLQSSSLTSRGCFLHLQQMKHKNTPDQEEKISTWARKGLVVQRRFSVRTSTPKIPRLSITD